VIASIFFNLHSRSAEHAIFRPLCCPVTMSGTRRGRGFRESTEAEGVMCYRVSRHAGIPHHPSVPDSRLSTAQIYYHLSQSELRPPTVAAWRLRTMRRSFLGGNARGGRGPNPRSSLPVPLSIAGELHRSRFSQELLLTLTRPARKWLRNRVKASIPCTGPGGSVIAQFALQFSLSEARIEHIPSHLVNDHPL